MNGKWRRREMPTADGVLMSGFYVRTADGLFKKADGENPYRRKMTRQVSMHTLTGFNELRLNAKLCDASLTLDNGDTFPIHRSVLSGSSDYFRSVYAVIFRRPAGIGLPAATGFGIHASPNPSLRSNAIVWFIHLCTHFCFAVVHRRNNVLCSIRRSKQSVKIDRFFFFFPRDYFQ